MRGAWEAVGGWRGSGAGAGAGPDAGAGVAAGAVAVFRGIPYAAPPVGARRFAAPSAPRAWDGVRETVEFGPTPQRGERGITLIPEHSIPGDDTLSVNVWTPDPSPAARLPVVVWIHGGGYISGSPASPWYDGCTFARDGVVFVSLSYRLGFTGFGWIEGTTANRGVLDWVAALEWVQRNIAAFGGDADRVTIAGQSAGGGAVLTLLGVPAARGLFCGGYAMSAAIADPSVAAAAERTRALARVARVIGDVDGLSTIPEARLLELERRITAPAAPHLLRDLHGMLRSGLMIGPIADGDVVPGDTLASVAHGPNAGVPLVLGSADDELVGMFPPRPLLDHLPRRGVLRALGADGAAADRWLADPEAIATESSVVLVGRYATDAVFRSWVPRVAGARSASPASGATWSYRFAWHAPESELGAPHHAGHCVDVPFVFDRLDAAGVERVAGARPPQALADAVHGTLVAFAESGDPGWAADDGGTGPSRIFDAPVRDELDAYASARKLLSV